MPVVVALLLAVALLTRVGVALTHWPYGAVSPMAQASPASQRSREVDLPAVQSLKLFGANSAAQANAGATTKVATTDLDLALQGVVLASDGKDSRAFIVSNGQQHTYKSGDTLPAGAGVMLGLVARDHVLVRNNGIEQALWLYDANHRPSVKGAGEGNARMQSAAVPGKGSASATPSEQAAPQQIHKATARLAEVFEVAPAVANGKLIGYQLSPGSRLKDFVQLGFKTNDILTSINGIALNDTANLPELYSLMNKPGDVSFSIMRDGSPLTLQMTMAP